MQTLTKKNSYLCHNTPMKRRATYTGSTLPIVLITGIIGLLTFVGLNANTIMGIPEVDMRMEPRSGVLQAGETFVVQVIVESNIAVNAFAGDIFFNTEVLKVKSIDYNTSIADLWAERPWYSNGEGSINFAGGTTRPGGFTGTDILLTITFETKQPGAGQISLDNARILQHDGFGTDAQLEKPVDSLFAVETPGSQRADVLHKSDLGTAYVVTSQEKSTDLNGDGKQSIADVSTFMVHIAQKNLRSDFNDDGVVSLADLSIIMQAQ